MGSDVGWKRAKPELTDEEIRRVEKELGLGFPEDYRDIVRQHSGAVPTRTDFTYRHPVTGKLRGDGLAHLLPLRSEEKSSVLAVMGWLGDQLPERVVPVGGNGGGNYICLDYRRGAPPGVSLWLHEETIEGCLVPLAGSFTEFLEMLSDPQDDEEP